MEFPRQLVADTETRAGRMLSAGDVRITVNDTDTGDHVTVRFKAMKDNRQVDGVRPIESENRNWLRVALAEATHVFVEVPNVSGDYPDKIGTFYPKTTRFFPYRYADPARVTAAVIAAEWLNSSCWTKTSFISTEIDRYIVREESFCGVCGAQLTDPESIEKGIGPTCNGRPAMWTQFFDDIIRVLPKDQRELLIDALQRYEVVR